MERYVREWYVRWIRPRIQQAINRQRLKMLWFVWGYWPMLSINTLSIFERAGLIARFLRVDWNIPHSHRPSEISIICKALAERPAHPEEVMLEAGCWQGGSSAKFSIICDKLGYKLHIYDSFEGVEKLPAQMWQKSFNYSGEYAAPEPLVRNNLMRYGEIGVCSTHKGWFSETLAKSPVLAPIRVAYIDCDIAKGTYEVLLGVMPGLVHDGWVFSQDFHIEPVRDLLHDPATWKQFGRGNPKIKRICGNLASVRFGEHSD
jgi:O-methyltransferase